MRRSIQHVGSEDAPIEELGHQFAVALGYNPNRVRLLQGGNENHVVCIEQHKGDDVVVRFPQRTEPQDLDVFQVEAWCAAAAAVTGLRTPSVLHVAEIGGRPVMVQQYARGGPVEAADLAAWEAIGAAAAKLTTISTEAAPAALFTRFGRDLDRAWQAHLDYNIHALTPDDPLRALDLYSAASIASMRRALERLRRRDLRQGLVHGDLHTRNLINGPDGYTVLDWGAAQVGPTPWMDLRRIHHWWVTVDADSPVTHQALLAALHGAGIRESEAVPVILELTLLHALDVTRWVLAQHPDRLQEFLPDAQATITRTL